MWDSTEQGYMIRIIVPALQLFINLWAVEHVQAGVWQEVEEGSHDRSLPKHNLVCVCQVILF